MTPAIRPYPTKPDAFARWADPAIALLIIACCLFLEWDRIRMPFAADDTMNIISYFRPGPWRVFTYQFTLWQNQYRPMGGAFYLPLYYLFGLNSAPYQIVIMLIMSANAWLLFRFARSLGCGRLEAVLPAIVGGYHAGLTNLHYNIDMVYDVLCFFFYFMAFVYYTETRKGNRLPSARQTALFLLLYLCTLNSKEMAVTLPVVLLAYELLYYRPEKWSGSSLWAWLMGPGRIVVFSAALNLPYIYGRAFGANPLMKQPAYAPVFSVQRLLDFQQGSVSQLLCSPNPLGLYTVAAIWIVITALAWLRRKRVLRFCWLFMILSPLPIEFLKDRFQGALYIPMAGWVVFAAVILVDAVHGISALIVRKPQSRLAVGSCMITLALIVWFRDVKFRKDNFINPAGWDQGVLVRRVISQMRTLKPHIRRHGRLVILHDPFVDWDMAFISQLYFADPDLDIHLQRLNPLPAAELPTADLILDFRDGKLVQVK